MYRNWRRTSDKSKKHYWSSKGVVHGVLGATQMWHVHWFDSGKSMTLNTFVQDDLSLLELKIEEEGSIDEEFIYIHYDNAMNHNAQATQQFLKEKNLPELATSFIVPTCRREIFTCLAFQKGQLKGRTFETVEVITTFVNSSPMRKYITMEEFFSNLELHVYNFAVGKCKVLRSKKEIHNTLIKCSDHLFQIEIDEQQDKSKIVVLHCKQGQNEDVDDLI
ncbi:MAG: hypothetical protein EZS28_035983 [Streblomastix strix]|uniref:Uncharacterized protein n=1 Tax=Streblomastix strix TaxID=222440 RepID=A0A5J4UEB9_9EUKA|nr:MAG: hypothetical protein EZS28_035983 [Streblomastix strix]